MPAESEHGLRVQLATALSDAAYFKASYARKLEDEKRALEAASATMEELAAANARAEAAERTSEKRLTELTKYYEAHGKELARAKAAQEALAAARLECERMRTALTTIVNRVAVDCANAVLEAEAALGAPAAAAGEEG